MDQCLIDIQLSAHLLDLSSYFVNTLLPLLEAKDIPQTLVSLPSHLQPSSHSRFNESPSPIIPVLTPHPRPLSAYLLALGMNARPITWPTVPKGLDRVRVCLHAGNSREDIDRLIQGIIGWALETMNSAPLVEIREREKYPRLGMLESKL